MQEKNIVKNYNGKMFIENFESKVFPIEYLIKYFTKLESSDSKKFYEFCYSIELAAFMYSSERIKKVRTYIKKIDFFINKLNNLGYGKIYFISWNRSSKKILFECKNPIYSKTKNKLFTNHNNKDFFIEYALKGFLEAITKKKIESNCIIKNKKNRYEFIVKNSNSEKKILNINENAKLLKEKKLCKVLKGKMANKNIKIKNGEMLINQTNLVSIPTLIFNLTNTKHEDLCPIKI